MYKILLVGGIKGYTEYHEHIIQILQKLNSDISDLNTQFITLQPYVSIRKNADLYIDDFSTPYFVVSNQVMEKFKYKNTKYITPVPTEEPEIEDFNRSFDGSFDYVITEHAFFCNSVEILKYHNLLKVNGYFIRYATCFFPDSDISYIESEDHYSYHYADEKYRIRNDVFLKNIENIFQRRYPNIFQKITDTYYDIEEHSIKYEEHCVNYLLNVTK